MADYQSRQSDDEKARKAPDKPAAEASPEMETRPRDSLGLAVQRAEQAPHLLQQTDALRLQGSVGNRAVEQLVAPQPGPAGQPRLQRKIDQLILRKESEQVQRAPEDEEELKTAAPPAAPAATMAPAAPPAPEPEVKAEPPAPAAAPAPAPAPAPPAPAAPDTKLEPEPAPQTGPPIEEEEVKG